MRRWGWMALLAMAAPAAAQERPLAEMDLPRAVAEEIVDFFNSASTIRFQGRAEVPAGRVIQGDVAVLGGPIRVAGQILGDVVVVNGDLVVVPGGRVTGDVTVVGGEALTEAGSVGGTLTVYDEPLSYRRRGERITYDERPWASWGERRRRGTSYISVRSEGNYNRVEGLPVMFGPVFRSPGDDYFRVEAMGVWRSEAGIRLAPREWGYLARVEQHLGPSGHVSLGATAHSLITPIEDSGVRDVEASLSTFLLHRDFRDYYEREGFSAFVRYDDPDEGLRITAEYRDEDHGYAAYGSPWTIRGNDSPWRAQPLVGQGRIRTLGAELKVDDRNDRDDPSDGWYFAASAVAGVGGSLTLPGYRSFPTDRPGSTPQVVVAPRELGSDFSAGTLDLRRYARLGPSADIRVRGFLGGSIDGAPLPPQYQRALGGEGSLPGYRVMRVDCGARRAEFAGPVNRGVEGSLPLGAYPAYGCDRVALFQAEYRGSLSFSVDFGGNDEWDEGWGWYPTATLNPSWSVFFDAGRGWTLSQPGEPGYLGPSSDTLMDVGLGFFLGDLGLYWAWPLTGEDRDVNFFIRISHRF